MDIQDLDAEARFGIAPASWTAGKWWSALIFGAVLTMLFYGIMMLLRLRWGGVVAIEMFFHGGAAHRSVIPYATMFLSFWALAILIIKQKKLAVQSAALAALPPMGENAAAALAERFPHPEDFLGASLFAKCFELENASPSDRAELMEIAFADAERASENSYTILRGMIWAVPVLGFIGTVLGLAQAVGSFGALTGGSQAVFETALMRVTGGLATAFETTLIALSAALVLQLYSTFLMHREEVLLERAKAAANA